MVNCIIACHQLRKPIGCVLLCGRLLDQSSSMSSKGDKVQNPAGANGQSSAKQHKDITLGTKRWSTCLAIHTARCRLPCLLLGHAALLCWPRLMPGQMMRCLSEGLRLRMHGAQLLKLLAMVHHAAICLGLQAGRLKQFGACLPASQVSSWVLAASGGCTRWVAGPGSCSLVFVKARRVFEIVALFVPI